MDLTAFITSAIDKALDGLPLDPSDRDRVCAHLSRRAFNSPLVKEKFLYSLDDSRYKTRVEGPILARVKTPPPGDEVEAYPARFVEPRFARIRAPKQIKINVRYKISDEAKLFFQSHFGGEVRLDYVDQQPHDHAVAAVSRRLEMDIMLHDLWQRGCDVLTTPINYNFSVIDIGGDWRLAEERKHHGMHVCAPLLSPRDEARQIRKTIANPRSTISVCHDTFQKCVSTAPFGISLHSCYDIEQEDLCKGMLKRSMKLVVGTLLLPEGLEQMKLSKTYTLVDGIYNMHVTYTPGRAMLHYVPPALRAGVNKITPSNRPDIVTYRFMNGASLPYHHKYSTLMGYSKNRIVSLNVGTTVVRYQYKIVRRVGSLIFFNMELIEDNAKPFYHQEVAAVHAAPYNGYMIKADPSLINIRDSALDGFKVVYIPRLLFDYVATYAMTKVGLPDFTIDNVMSYAKSAMTKTRINEYTIDLAEGADSMETLVATSIVAYKWAHDRVRLINSRVPHGAYLKIRENTVNDLVSLFKKSVDTTALLNTIKETVMDMIVSTLSKGKFTSVGDTLSAQAESIYNTITGALSQGVVVLVDCQNMVVPICPRNVANDASAVSSDDVNVAYLVQDMDPLTVLMPEFPDYSGKYVEKDKLLKSRRSKECISKSIKNVVESVICSDESRRQSYVTPPESIESVHHVGAKAAEPQREVREETQVAFVDNRHSLHIHAIRDFIELHASSQSEAEDAAKTMLKRALTASGNRVKSMTDIQALQKGNPVVIHIRDREILGISTLERSMLIAGTPEYDDMYSMMLNKKFGTLKLRSDTDKVEDRHPVFFTLGAQAFPNGVTGVTYDAILLPDLQITNAHLLRPLTDRLRSLTDCYVYTCKTILVDGVAGCGKTEEQSKEYVKYLLDGKNPLVLTATRVAAQQVVERVSKRLATLKMQHEANCTTVDSFLMHSDNWSGTGQPILMDEALQMHAGKIFAVIELLAPRIIQAFGDTHQIGFINFSRTKNPSVKTSYEYDVVEKRNGTWRISNGPRITMLRDAALYGPTFFTNKAGSDVIRGIFTCKALMGLLSVKWIYNTLNLSSHEQLLILVYRADVAEELRVKFNVKRDFPEFPEKLEPDEYNVAVSTMGESQGNDVDHSVVLRLSSRDEPLYKDAAQTIVGLTRSKLSWSYMAVPSMFESLLERVILKTELKFKVIGK